MNVNASGDCVLAINVAILIVAISRLGLNTTLRERSVSVTG